MGLLAWMIAAGASIVPLFLIPFGTGAWFFMAIITGLICAPLGWGLIGVQALSDGGGITHFLWWAAALVLGVGGAGVGIYGIAILIWRGAGLHISVTST